MSRMDLKSKFSETLRKSPRGVNNDKGYTLVEAIVAAGMVGITLLGFSSIFLNIQKASSSIDMKNEIRVVSTNLLNSAFEPEALATTLLSFQNEISGCLNPTGEGKKIDVNSTNDTKGCIGKEGELKVLYNRAGQVVFDGTKSWSGLRADGSSCDTYGKQGDCIYRPIIKVSYECADASCSSAMLRYSIIMQKLDPSTGKVETAVIDSGTKDLDSVLGKWSLSAAAPPVQEIKTNETFKLLIIVDNSTSMLLYQQKLAENVATMLDSLQGLEFGISVQVMTTSQYIMFKQYSWVYRSPMASSAYQMNNVAFKCEGYTGLCESVMVAKGISAGTQTETLTMKSIPTYTLPYGAGSVAFGTFKKSVQDAITGVGTSGSDDEQPLCSLSRALIRQTPFFNRGDHAGIIIIGNEDDNSTTASCSTVNYRNYTKTGLANWYASPILSDSLPNVGGDYTKYYIKKTQGNAGYQIFGRCAAFSDGQMVNYDAANLNTYYPYDNFINGQVSNTPSSWSSDSLAKWGIDINKTCEASDLGFTSTAVSPYVTYRYGYTARKSWMIDCPASVIDKLEQVNSNITNCSTVTNSVASKRVRGKVIPGQCKISCASDFNWIAADVYLPSETKPLLQYDYQSTSLCNSHFSYDTVSSYFAEGISSNMRKIRPKFYGGSAGTMNKGILDMVKAQSGSRVWTNPVTGSDAASCFRIPYVQRPYPDQANVRYDSVYKDSAFSAMTISQAAVGAATDLFGSRGYFVSAIIHPTKNNPCALSTNESAGTKIESYLSGVTKKVVTPLCAETYAPALEPLRQFIIDSLENSRYIELDPRDKIVGVFVSNASGSFELKIVGSEGVSVSQLGRSETGKIRYKLDFVNTGYSLKPTDSVFVKKITKFEINFGI